MDSRRNKFRPRGRNRTPWWNQNSSPTQSRPNPFHQRQGGRHHDDFDYQYSNPYHSRKRPNFFREEGDNYQNNSKSIKDFFFRESNTTLPGTSKPPEENPWSDEAQEQAMKKKLSDVANRLKNKLKSCNAEEESESGQNETESDSGFSISDQLALLASDQQRSANYTSDGGNKEEPKRTAHVPKPVPLPQPSQPDIRRRSNEQKERHNSDSMSTISKVKDVQRNIQRKVIGELLSMPKTSLQMVLDDPKINPKIELGMSHLVKENRLLLAQKFRNLAESKMTNNEQFRESQFVSDVETLIDPDLAVDLCKLPPELIKQMGAMFQLDFESDLSYDTNAAGFPDDTVVANPFVNMDSSMSEIKGNEALSNVNKPAVQNTPAPKYAKYFKKKTEPQLTVQSEKNPAENVKPLSEILSNLRTTPEIGIESRKNDVMQSPAKEITDPFLYPKNQSPNEKNSAQIKDLISFLKVGATIAMQNKIAAQEFDKGPLPETTKEDINLLPKNLNQTFCDNIPLLEKCLNSSPIKSDQSVKSDASLPRSEGEVDNSNNFPWEKFFTPKPTSVNLRDENNLINDNQSSLPKNSNSDSVVIPLTQPRITIRKDLSIRDDIYSPNSSNSHNEKVVDSPDVFHDEWPSEDDFDFEKTNSKDKNQNIKDKGKPLSLAEKLRIMEKMQSQRSKKDGDESRRRVRNIKCKNFLERLEQANIKSGVEFNENLLVEENSNLSDGLSHVQSKVIDIPKVKKIDKMTQCDVKKVEGKKVDRTVQVDIQKDEPVSLFSIETALGKYVPNNKFNLEPLKRVFYSHVKDVHKNCKRIVPTDIRFTQTEIKEYESVLTQTIKPPEKVYKSLTTQTEIPAKIIKKPAETQTILKSDPSSCYGVPVPVMSVEETNENLLAEVKMIEKVVHKLNERKFAIFLKLTNLNNGSLSFASDGELSTTFLHTITNGDTSVWKHVLNKEPSKPPERRSHTSTSKERERSSHSHSKRHEASKRPHESKSSERRDRDKDRDRDKSKDKDKEKDKDKDKNVKKVEERRGSDGAKMKTKAELKSVSLSQLEAPKENLHLKKWLESQDPLKYEHVEDKKEAMSDAGSKKSKEMKTVENRSERSDSESRKRDKSAKSEASDKWKKNKEPEKASKDVKSSKKPEKVSETSKKSKVDDDKSPPAKKRALESTVRKDQKRKEPEKVKVDESIIESESICPKPELQQLVVNLKALERDLNDPQNLNCVGACIGPEVSQVPEVIDLDDHTEPMEITSTVDDIISKIQIDEPEGEELDKEHVDDEQTPSRTTRGRRKSAKENLTNEDKRSTQNRRVRRKSENSITTSHVPDVLPEASEPEASIINEEPPAGKTKKSRKKGGDGNKKKGKKGKAQRKRGKKINTPEIVEPDLEDNGEGDKETESQKPEAKVSPVILQIKRKRGTTDADSDLEISSVPSKNFKKKRRSRVSSLNENIEDEDLPLKSIGKKNEKKGVPEKFKRVVINSSSDSEVEELSNEKEVVNVSRLLKDCCVVIKRLNLPINKMSNDIPDSENKLVNQDKGALVEETKVNDVCDNKLSGGENQQVENVEESMGKEVEEEKLGESEKVEEAGEKKVTEEAEEKEKVEQSAEKGLADANIKKEVVEIPAEQEAVQQSAVPEVFLEEMPEKIAEKEVIEEKIAKDKHEEPEEKEKEALVEETPTEEASIEEKPKELNSEAIDSPPVNNSSPAVPLPQTTNSLVLEKDDDVLELTVNDSLTENMEVDATFEDSTASMDNDALDAPTVSDFDLRKADYDSSTISDDHSQTTLPVPNGDSLSRSEGLPSGPKKRKINPISFSCHKGVITEIKIINKYIFAACDDKTVYCYSIKSGKRKKEYAGHNGAVTCIAFSFGNKNWTNGYLFTGSLDNHVRSFAIKTSTLAKQSVELTSEVQCLDENWGTVFAGLRNGVVVRLNSKTLKVMQPPLDISQQPELSVMALKTFMEGPRRVFIAATKQQPITIRDAATGLLLRKIDYNLNAIVYSLTIDSNIIYCGTSLSTLLAFDFTDGSSVGEYECGPGLLSIKLVQHLIFASSRDGNIYVIDSKTKERISTIPGPGKVLSAMDIYKNRQIVASSNDGKMDTWAVPAHIRNLLKKVPNE